MLNPGFNGVACRKAGTRAFRYVQCKFSNTGFHTGVEAAAGEDTGFASRFFFEKHLDFRFFSTYLYVTLTIR